MTSSQDMSQELMSVWKLMGSQELVLLNEMLLVKESLTWQQENQNCNHQIWVIHKEKKAAANVSCAGPTHFFIYL